VLLLSGYILLENYGGLPEVAAPAEETQ
jgi:hypothetical protein